MRRFTLTIAVFALAACQRSAPAPAVPPAPATKAAPAPPATTTTATDQPPDWGRFVFAAKLADAYDKNPVAADRDYKGKTFDVLGLVSSIDREYDGSIMVRLQAGPSLKKESAASRLLASHHEITRMIQCFFSGTAIEGVADIEAGQLVDIRGEVVSPQPPIVVPTLRNASVAWAGAKPGAVIKPDKQRVETSIKSAFWCVGRSMLASSSPEKRAEAEAELAKMEAEGRSLPGWLSCPHPLSLLTVICDDARGYSQGGDSVIGDIEKARLGGSAPPDTRGLGQLFQAAPELRREHGRVQVWPECAEVQRLINLAGESRKP